MFIDSIRRGHNSKLIKNGPDHGELIVGLGTIDLNCSHHISHCIFRLRSPSGWSQPHQSPASRTPRRSPPRPSTPRRETPAATTSGSPLRMWCPAPPLIYREPPRRRSKRLRCTRPAPQRWGSERTCAPSQSAAARLVSTNDLSDAPPDINLMGFVLNWWILCEKRRIL